MLFDPKFLVEHAVLPFLSQDVAKFALYMLHHNNIEIGSTGQLIADKVISSVVRCYNGVNVRTIFTARTAFHSIHKDVPAIFQQSNSIYKCQNYRMKVL